VQNKGMSTNEIAHLEELSKLTFTEKERKNLHFESVLEFVSQIKNAKIGQDVAPQKIGLGDLRADEVRLSLDRADVLRNAPKSTQKYFVTPQVVE
jgi:aspartyl/glutamyl-tRNA(Asn/Gln) amidotransferase C subunit